MPDQIRSNRRFGCLFVGLCLSFGIALAVLSDHVAVQRRVSLFPTLSGILLLLLGGALVLSPRFAALMDDLNRSSRGRLYARVSAWVETRFPDRASTLLTRYIPGAVLVMAGATFIYVGAFLQ